MRQTFRKLSKEEISQLILQGCYSEEWNLIEVAENFLTDHVRNSHFSGFNKLGCFDEEITLFGGVKMKTGIKNAHLHNCIIGNNALIHNVKSYIANYRIGDRVVIHNINELAVDKKSSFGNGIRIKVINESGGREIPIYDLLSSQLAYILALYRHRTMAVTVIENLSY